MPNVSFAAVKKELTRAGLKVTKNSDGEIRVAFPGNESAAYYTDCAEDALDTGRAMLAQERPKNDIEGEAIERGDHVPGEPFDAKDYAKGRAADLRTELAKLEAQTFDEIGAETLEEFANEIGLNLETVSVSHRPDAHEGRWPTESNHFHLTLTRADKSEGFKADRSPIPVWAGYYTTGPAHPLIWVRDGAKLTADRAHMAAALARKAYRGLDDKTGLKARTVHDAPLYETIREAYRKAAPLNLRDVLESLQCDCSGWDEHFEEWAEGLGYDSDSRKAYAIYESCQKAAKTLRNGLGATNFERFLHATPEA